MNTMTEDESNAFACPQCPKIFATRSNLKRHMENPNIHNIPYARSRDQKRWKGHAKKVSSKAETTERMRKWRAENRDKNKRNDLRCRVYRLARQKFGEEDSEEKQQFIRDEINRRLGRRMLLEQQKSSGNGNTNHSYSCNVTIIKQEPTNLTGTKELNELPFYCAPLHKIELPSIDMNDRRPSHSNTEPSVYSNKSQSTSPVADKFWHDERRRHSMCSVNSTLSSHHSVSQFSTPKPTSVISNSIPAATTHAAPIITPLSPHNTSSISTNARNLMPARPPPSLPATTTHSSAYNNAFVIDTIPNHGFQHDKIFGSKSKLSSLPTSAATQEYLSRLRMPEPIVALPPMQSLLPSIPHTPSPPAPHSAAPLPLSRPPVNISAPNQPYSMSNVKFYSPSL